MCLRKQTLLGEVCPVRFLVICKCSPVLLKFIFLFSVD